MGKITQAQLNEEYGQLYSHYIVTSGANNTEYFATFKFKGFKGIGGSTDEVMLTDTGYVQQLINFLDSPMQPNTSYGEGAIAVPSTYPVLVGNKSKPVAGGVLTTKKNGEKIDITVSLYESKSGECAGSWTIKACQLLPTTDANIQGDTLHLGITNAQGQNASIEGNGKIKVKGNAHFVGY